MHFIYGAGECGRVFLLNSLDGNTIEAFIDDDEVKIGKTILGKPIISSKELEKYLDKELKIVVAVNPGFYETIKNKLEKKGLVENRNFYNAMTVKEYTKMRYGQAIIPYYEMNESHEKIIQKMELDKKTIVSEDRLSVLYQMLESTSFVDGSVAEVGVYKGGSAYLLASLCKE